MVHSARRVGAISDFHEFFFMCSCQIGKILQNLSIVFLPTDDFECVKKKIYEREEIPNDQQRLSLLVGKKLVREHVSLSEYIYYSQVALDLRLDVRQRNDEFLQLFCVEDAIREDHDHIGRCTGKCYRGCEMENNGRDGNTTQSATTHYLQPGT